MAEGKVTFFVHWPSGTVPLPLRRGDGPLDLEQFKIALKDSLALVEASRQLPGILHFEYEDDEGDRMAVRTEEEFLAMLAQVVTVPVAHIFPVLESYGNCSSSMSVSPQLLRGNLAFDSESAFHEVLNVHQLNMQAIEKLDVLGSGHCGTVYKAFDKEGNRLMAVKCVSLDVCPEIQSQIVMELEILNQCSSPYVVGFYGAVLEENHISMCMEFMNAGSLEDRKPVPEPALGHIAVAVVEGLNYIWSLKIMHRDIKPSNILLDYTGSVKLCDFGVSTQLEQSIAKSYVGTGMYMAPERILGGEYRVHSDIWSLGVTLLEGALGVFPFGEIAPGKPPFNEAMHQLFQKNDAVDLSYPGLSTFSLLFRDFLSRCLVIQPQLRISPVDLKEHPVIQRDSPFSSEIVRDWLSSSDEKSE